MTLPCATDLAIIAFLPIPLPCLPFTPPHPTMPAHRTLPALTTTALSTCLPHPSIACLPLPACHPPPLPVPCATPQLPTHHPPCPALPPYFFPNTTCLPPSPFPLFWLCSILCTPFACPLFITTPTACRALTPAPALCLPACLAFYPTCLYYLTLHMPSPACPQAGGKRGGTGGLGMGGGTCYL